MRSLTQVMSSPLLWPPTPPMLSITLLCTLTCDMRTLGPSHVACMPLSPYVQRAYMQALHSNEDVTSLRTVTPQEATLAAHYRLEVKSWLAVLPVAHKLSQDFVRARHLHMLIEWLAVCVCACVCVLHFAG